MKRLRKLFYTVMVLLAVAGLVYTLSLDTSTPVVLVEEDAPPEQVQEVLDATTYHQVVYTKGTTQLQFTLNDQGQWQWLDDTSFPLNPDWIATLVSDLDSETHVRSIPLSEEMPLSDYGLDKPWGSITATKSDGSQLELYFGSSASDTTCYALKNGDLDTLYIYNSQWLDVLGVPIYDMMVLPTLPPLTASEIQSVTVSDTLTLLPQMSDGLTTWYYQADNTVADLPYLMNNLTRWSIAQCFSYKPSEQAVSICGFDAPTALTVTYGDSKDDTLTLYCGTVAMDEAYRYVRLEGDDTIYLIEDALVSTLIGLSTPDIG